MLENLKKVLTVLILNNAVEYLYILEDTEKSHTSFIGLNKSFLHATNVFHSK